MKFNLKLPKKLFIGMSVAALCSLMFVSNSYASIEDALRERADELYPEDAQDPSYYDLIMDEVYHDNVLIYVHRLNPEFTRNMSSVELDEILADMDYQEFVSLYCFKQ